MPETVAVHILDKHVMLARAETGSEGARVTKLVCREVQDGEAPRDVAAQMIRQHGIENLGLALAMNWESYSIRDAWMPFTGDSQIRSTIKYELEDDLDLAADAMLMPYQVLEQRPDASHLLAWALPKATLAEILRPWESAGISPEYVPPDVMGHVGLVDALAGDLADRPLVAVSGDDRSVHVTLLEAGHIWAHRRLLNFAWATDAAGRPLQEIRRTFLGTPGFPEPEAVVSFGGEAADTLAGVVASDLGVPHRAVPAPEAPPGERALRYWPLVAGVALFMAGHSQRPLSFRMEEFEPKETVQVVSLLGVVATGLLGFVLLLGGFMLHLAGRNARDDLADTRAAYDAFWAASGLPEGTRPGLATLSSTLNRHIDTMRKQIEEARRRPNAIKRFASLADRMGCLPPDITLDMTLVDVKPDSILLTGTTNTYNAATALNSHINTSKELSATISNITPQPDDQAKFNMKITYKDADED